MGKGLENLKVTATKSGSSSAFAAVSLGRMEVCSQKTRRQQPVAFRAWVPFVFRMGLDHYLSDIACFVGVVQWLSHV